MIKQVGNCIENLFEGRVPVKPQKSIGILEVRNHFDEIREKYGEEFPIHFSSWTQEKGNHNKIIYPTQSEFNNIYRGFVGDPGSSPQFSLRDYLDLSLQAFEGIYDKKFKIEGKAGIKEFDPWNGKFLEKQSPLKRFTLDYVVDKQDR